MGRNTRLSPYAKGSGEEFDEDASVIEFMSYRSAPSASKGNMPPDDSVPLFLSDHDEEPPRRPSFGRVRSEDADSPRVPREPVSPRIIKASILAAAVVAIVVAIFAVGNPLALFANAKASLAGTAAGLSGAPNQVAAVPSIQRVSPEPVRAAPEPVVAIRSASADPTAQEIQPNLGARAVSPTARSGPTRDEIASAFKTARQGQPEAAPPPAAAPVAPAPVVAAAPAAAVPSAAPPAARRIDPEELATLLKRAKSLISIGDIAPARLLLKRAADAQEATAALLLAQTYDPAVLGKQDMRSIAPDPALAREWYQKAARYGSVDAQQRLSQMQN
jgi:hypothetical protein